MKTKTDPQTAAAVASEIDAQIRALFLPNTPNIRAIRRSYSQKLKGEPAAFVLDVARELIKHYNHREVAYELIHDPAEAFKSLDEAKIEELGVGIDSWWSVDTFARILSGPAWLKGQISDAQIHRWARSADRWWRRAALVSTVALNMKASGGGGDTPRTLAVCHMLVADYDDMVVKALSWALRVLAPRDPEAVRAFLTEQEATLAARVKREVTHKLTTGLKNPKLSRNASKQGKPRALP